MLEHSKDGWKEDCEKTTDRGRGGRGAWRSGGWGGAVAGVTRRLKGGIISSGYDTVSASLLCGLDFSSSPFRH